MLRGMLMKRLLVTLTLCVAVLIPSLVSAEVFDSSRQWMTLKTPHFFVRYAEESEYLAKKSAEILEEAYADFNAKFNWKPWGRTEVVFLDSADMANGMAAVLPYNWMILYAAPPIPEKTLGYYDDWLRLLIYHELTHIYHLDAARGWWKAFRFVLGKTVAPAGLVPVWIREGEAVYVESAATKAGRLRYSNTDMVLRSAILEHRFPTISKGDGFQWTWPAYHIPYLLGGEFIEWLVATYGFEKLQAFNERTQRTLMLSMVNYAARTVYGKTFVELWKEWKEELEKHYYGVEGKVRAQGLTPTKVQVGIDPKWEEYSAAPALSPDGKKLLYSMTSPHTSSAIRLLDLETGEIQNVVKKQSANQLAWSRDGKMIAYGALATSDKSRAYEDEQQEYPAPKPTGAKFETGIFTNIFYDIYLYDVKKGTLKRLTRGKRARDPDFTPDGKNIVYVERDDRSTEVLKIYNIESETSRSLTPASPVDARFANPRVSPDGKWIAVSAWDPKNNWKIYRYSIDGRSRMRLTKLKRGMELRPWWTPDSEHVLFSSDVTGIANIYRVNTHSGKVEQLTNVLTGAFQPTTHDGRTIAIQYYTSHGFELHTFQAPPVGRGKKMASARRGGYGLKRSGAQIAQEEGEYALRYGPDGKYGEDAVPGQWPKGKPIHLNLEPKKYSPFGKSLFLPRFIIPAITYTENEFFMAAALGGSDVLRWHNWLGGITYMTGANYAGYFFRYWYNRWKPIMGLGIMDYVVNYGNRTFAAIDPNDPNNIIYDTRHYWEKRRNMFAFISYPWQRHLFTLSYSFENRDAQSALLDWQRQALSLGRFAGFTFRYNYNDTENYRASISPENGRKIKVQASWTDRYFGSNEDNEQIIVVGDWREFIRTYRHQVLALRIHGGMNWGDQLTQGTFTVGGAWGEGALSRQSSLYYFPLRGLPAASLGATRALVMSAEYRIPLISPQSGLGTWPIALQNIHAAFFADFGDGWVADSKSDNIQDFFDDFLLGIGAELRGDFIIGHGLAVKGRLGYSIIVFNRDRIIGFKDPILQTDAKYGVLILELGTSF